MEIYPFIETTSNAISTHLQNIVDPDQMSSNTPSDLERCYLSLCEFLKACLIQIIDLSEFKDGRVRVRSDRTSHLMSPSDSCRVYPRNL